MNKSGLNIMAVCQAAVRQYAKGNDDTDAEIRRGIERTVPGTITAVAKACATGAWAPIIEKSRAANMAAKRAAAHADAAPPVIVVPPKKGK